MKYIINVLFLKVLILSAHGILTSSNLRPTLYTRNGHLFIGAAYDCNVTIVTKGLHVNDLDVMTVLKKAHNALKTEESFQRSADSYQDRLNMIEQKLMFYETHSTSANRSIVVPNFPNVNWFSINRRINGLRRRLNNLRNLLLDDDCRSNPCKNGGTCIDMFANFRCLCPPQWEGSTCEDDVNECSRFVGTDLGCQNGASCVNKQGSYECLCLSGWYGVHCTKSSATCSSGSTELCGHGICVPQNNAKGYKCICDQGWTIDATTLACTVDVDECKLNHPPCSTNPIVPCINTPGSFACGSCPAGFTGNGYYCADINECESFNGGCSTNPMVQCINSYGSSSCGMCPPGYFGDGKQCEFKGVCNVNNGGCHYLAQCRNNPSISSTYVECVCPPGYIGNGIGPNGCTRLSGDSFNPCNPNPCKNGLCLRNTNSTDYVCRCRPPFTGRNCDIERNPCATNPCQNGGTCQVFIVYARCVCPQGFTGHFCQNEEPACGGRLNAEEGVLKYPPSDYNNYKHSVSCAWTIETNSTKVLNLTFTKFDIEKSHACKFDWLQIHDGMNSASHIIGRFCGNEFPNNGTIISTHNVIYIWFRSDHTISKHGFELNWTTVDPVCGGFFNSPPEFGNIQSPGSPGNYPLNRDCIWTLTAPPNKRYLFHFFSLIIGDNPDCSKDYLEFKDGDESLFAKFCNTSHPAPLYSSGPVVIIHFHSNDVDSYPGFQLSYSVIDGLPGCGGVFTNSIGEIHSPTIDGVYPPDLFCEYKIKRKLQSRIKLSFISFNMEDSVGCKFDYVSIHEGPDVNSPLIGRYCGSEIPAPYISHGNEITIIFKTDWATSMGGFRLKYQTVCGGMYSDPSGIIESPNYPGRYDAGSSCIYEIIQKPGYIISLSFIDLNLEQNSQPACIYDAIEVRDGDNANSTLIGRFCKGPIPTIMSSHNYLWISFKSDFSVDGHGFRANYSTTFIGCGGILKEKVGSIASPSHPTGYPSEKKCTWIISAPKNHVIQLTWVTFHLEYSVNCAYDSITVYDNNTGPGLGGLMGKFCGNTPPETMFSSSNLMTIVFESDTSISMDGFLGAYSFLPENQVCGGNYLTPAGVIKSPQYPDNYPIDKKCIWKITVSPGNQILLNVTDFKIESYMNCRYDWLEIRNGGSSASPLIGRYCGSSIPKIIPSHSNQLYLEFNSDATKTGHGFKIKWMSTATGCGGSLISPNGSIISPYYPEPYSRNTECYWKVTVSAGSVIRVIFADLDLEKHTKCLLDYVELFDGLKLNSPSLGKFCRPTYYPITTTQNQMLVKFRSDVNFQGRGFQLHYSTVCTNEVTGFSGVIESPNFPNSYPENQFCDWSIKVSQGNKINITFSHFKLERLMGSVKTNSCQFDYLEIINAANDEQTTLGKYCTSSPGFIHIPSDSVRIKFVTDNLMSSSGFRLEWKLDGCGGILKQESGIIKSPNYPERYPYSCKCEWLIEVEYDKSVELTLNVVDVETDAMCEYDYIAVYNGRSANEMELSKICHQKKPTVISSSGNNMFVQFASDISNQGKGFYATYKTIDSKCGGKMVSKTGTIASPNYPKNYNKNDTCEWLIEVDENHTIELEFVDIDLYSPSCDSSYVKVFDGPYASYPTLVTACGSQKPNGTIKSTYNQMYIEFKGQPVYTSKGFQVRYSKSCGARIETSSNGNIEVDGPVEDTCTWTIVATKPSDRLSLTFSHLERLTECDSEYQLPRIAVYNGETSDSPLISEYCGDKAPPTIYSDGAAIHLVVKEGVHFFATYRVVDSHCGGTLSNINGYISTPGYPRTYAVNTQCEWTIDVSPGNHVSLSFEEFELLESKNCVTDYLEVRKNNGTGELLGLYCGNNVPTNITHLGSLWLMFSSSNFSSSLITAKGFLAEYSINLDNVLTGSKGEIASPLYPKYSPGIYSTYKIIVSFGKRILITFKDVTSYQFLTECYSDFNIYDGPNEESPVLTSCSNMEMKPVKSTSNVVFLNFNSYVGQPSKFLLEWMEVDNVYEPRVFNASEIPGCGSQETIDINALKEYTLTSPGYPYGYKPNLMCEWIFSTTSMNHLKILFEDVNFSFRFTSNLCFGDVVKIYEMNNDDNDWTFIKNVCYRNMTHEDPIRTTNLMKVVFQTNSYYNGTGFKAQIKDECGGSLTEKSGYIIFDNSTRRSDECRWNITVRPGRTIKVTFLKLDLGLNLHCNSYLLLRNGVYKDSPLLGNGKYCGDFTPGELNTTSNKFSVYYLGILGTFKLRYEEISTDCGGEITLRDTTDTIEISSPNYPNIPNPYTECTWLITAPPGETLKIDFEERFDLNMHIGCQKEYVSLNDGGTELAPSLGKYCGRTPPSSQITTDNMLYVKYFTEIDIPKNGFKAKISVDDCGGTIRGFKGKLQFTDKNNLGKPKNCTWYFIGLKNSFLTLSFDFLDISQNNCTSNRIVVSEKNVALNKVNVLGTFCGRNVPPAINSTFNKVQIDFIMVKPKFINKGFKLSFKSQRQVCGGVTRADAGFIQTPGYPTQTFEGNCKWTIIVPKGRRITFKFIDADLIGGAKMVYEQGVAFYNSATFTNLITVFRPGNSIENPIESSDNEMTIIFWSMTGSNHRGFRAGYTSNNPTVCTGDFTKDSGIIKSPDINSYACKWENELAKNKTLSMTVDMFTNNSEDICVSLFPYVSIEFGNQVMKTCKTSKKTFRSPYPRTTLKASVLPKYKVNFTVVYDTHDCGGVLYGENGSILSPNYPHSPQKSYECAWLVKLPTTHTVKLTINNLDLGPDCEKHYLIIHNGDSPKHPKIGKFCQNNKPNVIRASSRSLWIEYKYQAHSAGTGFNLQYEPNIHGCGGTFHDATRIIESPGYSDHINYKDNTECIWEIRSEPGYFINLKFIDRFFIEDTSDCSDDYLEILDYAENKWVSLGKKCGRNIPHDIRSTGDKMNIIFRSGNNKITGSGFKAQWTLLCGGTFTATNTPQYVRSPGFPIAYASRLNCVYNITNRGRVINLSFEEFELEKGAPECAYDNLTITSAYSQGAVTYCGTDTPGDLRLKDLITIKFKTDRWMQKKGFIFMYKNEVCGGKITTEQTIKSDELSPSSTQRQLQFNNEYVTCKWEIEAPKGQSVVLRIRELRLPLLRNCQLYRMQIFKNFTENEADRLAVLCGDLSADPPVIHSPSNRMFIHLIYNVRGHGFEGDVQFTYGPEAGCGGNIVLSNSGSKTIRAPNNLENIDCQWTIQSPLSYAVKIQFDEINLASCNSNGTSCDCSYLEIRDGGASFSSLIETKCSSSNSKPQRNILTNTRFAYIRFVSSKRTSNAFKITVTPVMTTCGESVLNVTDHVQILRSPNYPSSYPSDTKCIWLMKAEPRERIVLHFVDFDLEHGDDSHLSTNLCRQDKLVIKDEDNKNIITEGLGPRIIYNRSKFGMFNTLRGEHQFCGKNDKIFDFYSPSNTLSLVFTSENSVNNGKGFLIEYLTAGCNRNYTSEQGRLVVAGERLTDCVTTITSPENTTISIYFSIFRYPASCDTASLTIRDGGKDDPVLLQACGYRLPNPVFSTGNKLWIHSTERTPFLVSYDFTYVSTKNGKGCGGDIYNYKGKIYSPMFPNSNRVDTLCTWNIRVPTSLTVALRFRSFDITGECDVNYLEIVAYTQGIPSKHKFCRGDLITTLYSDGHVDINYQSSITNTGRGWEAIFEGVPDRTHFIF